MADLNRNRNQHGVFLPARAGGSSAAGNVADIADRLQDAHQQAAQGYNGGLLQIAVKCSTAQVALQAGALNLYVPSNLVQQPPTQPPPIPKPGEDSEREGPRRPFPTSVIPGPLKKLLDDLRDVLKPLIDALQYALQDFKRAGGRPGQPPGALQRQAEEGKLLTLRAFTPAERAPFEAPAKAGPPPLPGGAANAAGAAEGSAGLRAAGVAVAVPLAIITAVMKSIELTQRQMDSMRNLGHVSPSMAGVFAQSDARDLARNIRRGEALAESARELNRELQRFKDNTEGIVRGWEKFKNEWGADLIRGINVLLEATGIGKAKEDAQNPKILDPKFNFGDQLPKNAGREARWRASQANAALFDMRREFFEHRRRFVEHGDDFGPDDLEKALRQLKAKKLRDLEKAGVSKERRRQVEEDMEDIITQLVRKERLDVEGRAERTDIPSPYAVWNEIRRRTTLEKHLHNPQFNRPVFK